MSNALDQRSTAGGAKPIDRKSRPSAPRRFALREKHDVEDAASLVDRAPPLPTDCHVIASVAEANSEEIRTALDVLLER